MCLVISRREEMKQFIAEKKLLSSTIGFVPTMGALHEGHAKLIKQSCAENNVCVVSIFVNPTQFAPHEDLSTYPRQFEKDYELCKSLGVSVIFAPTVQEMYPDHFSTQVSVKGLNSFLCGQFRPIFFDGVATVVLLLLNIVQPHQSYFGQKDFQQVQIIKQMLRDLAHPSNITMIPTVREDTGLAKSSRNVYLTETSRSLADTLPKALAQAAKVYLGGERQAQTIIEIATKILKENNITPQYLEMRSVQNLAQQIEGNVEEDCVLALAVVIKQENSQVRLIDNIILSESAPWKEVLEELIACAL